MKLKYKFRCYPTVVQQRQLAKEFGCARYAYNWALKLRTDSFKAGKPINYNASASAFVQHRQNLQFNFLRETSCVPQQQALRHLQTAFSNFFDKRAKYPKFKTKHERQTVTYTRPSLKFDQLNKNLSFPKIGRLSVKWSRQFTSSPTTVTITKDCAGRYFVTLCLDEPSKAALPKTGRQVGIDLGVSRLATLSNGERVANPRHTMKAETKLTKLSRRLSRKVKGSNRWKVQKLKVARLHAHIADSRKDHLDKLTTDLVKRFDVLAIEDLNVRGMIKNHCLAKHVSCASFGQFRRIIEYKVAWYGKEIRVADHFFPSSKRCSSCGHIHEKMPLEIRDFTCENCGEHHDRDENAAINILKFARASEPTTAGQAERQGRGERVRRGMASAVLCGARGSVNQPSSVRERHE